MINLFNKKIELMVAIILFAEISFCLGQLEFATKYIIKREVGRHKHQMQRDRAELKKRAEARKAVFEARRAAIIGAKPPLPSTQSGPQQARTATSTTATSTISSLLKAAALASQVSQTLKDPTAENVSNLASTTAGKVSSFASKPAGTALIQGLQQHAATAIKGKVAIPVAPPTPVVTPIVVPTPVPAPVAPHLPVTAPAPVAAPVPEEEIPEEEISEEADLEEEATPDAEAGAEEETGGEASPVSKLFQFFKK